MPRWFCRHPAATFCAGPRHDKCGLRYDAGEFRQDGNGDLHLDGITGPVRIPGLAQLPRGNTSAVIIRVEADGWTAEFLEATPSRRKG